MNISLLPRESARGAFAVPVQNDRRRLRVGLYVISVTRESYLIAKTFALAGIDVVVRIEMPPEHKRWAGAGAVEAEYCSWLLSEPEIYVVDAKDAPVPVDVLLFEVGPLEALFPEELAAWIKAAGGAVAWNINAQEQSLARDVRAELGTLVRFRAALWRASRMIVLAGTPYGRLSALLRPARRQGYFVHPIFLRDPKLRAEMFGVEAGADEERVVRLIFSGNPEPPARRAVLERIKGEIASSADTRVLDHFSDVPANLDASEKRVLWMMRADPRDPNWQKRSDVIPPVQWPGILRRCDFALCPPGFGKKTHRVVEALLQGVIPITDCPEEYAIGLKDGETCIAVRRDRWTDCVSAALIMDRSEIKRMRRAVQQLAREHLHHKGVTADWLHKLGVPALV